MEEDQAFEALCLRPGSALRYANGRRAMANLGCFSKDRLPKMIVTDEPEDRLNPYFLGRLIIKMHLHGGGVDVVSIRNRRRHLLQRPRRMSEGESGRKGVSESIFKAATPLTKLGARPVDR